MHRILAAVPLLAGLFAAGTAFIQSESRRPWIPFGYNYITSNRSDQQRLIEEIREGEWDTVASMTTVAASVRPDSKGPPASRSPHRGSSR